MVSNEFLAGDVLGHGRYLCIRRTDPGGRHMAPLGALAQRLGLRNEFRADGTGPSIAFLRRRGSTAGVVADDDVLDAEAVVHVFSTRQDTVDAFCGEAEKLLAPAGRVRVLAGVVRPKNYTGAAMNNWAYARQVTQRPGRVMPNAFLLPLSKTAEWWRKDWMERHTYFLPRYDGDGRMVSEGHALAAEKGIASLLRRTYRHVSEPAPSGEYDFVTYFECADADVPLFHQVCQALRDVARNPEWRFVREGPTWHGRRVASCEELFA